MSSSFDERAESSFIRGLCSSNSSKRYSGEYSVTTFENMMSLVTPIPVSAVNSTVASTINFVFPNSVYSNPEYSFLYFLWSDLFTFLPSSNASFSVSFDLATIK